MRHLEQCLNHYPTSNTTPASYDVTL